MSLRAYSLVASLVLLLTCCGESQPTVADPFPRSNVAGSAGVGGSTTTAGASPVGGATTSGVAGSTTGTGGGAVIISDPFDVVTQGAAVDIYVDAADSPSVSRAVGDLQADVERVSGTKPAIKNTTAGLSAQAVLVGTLGQSPLIDDLASRGKLDAGAISGKWESFVVQAVDDPVEGVKRALVIAGSDRRGTIYGIYDVSQAMGVSPWYWWADVAPSVSETVTVDGALRKQGEPSIKYRGIFINDEENFAHWSARKMDAGKQPGPETYKRVFELLLRLKANFLWPAMHEVSDSFNTYPENAQNADLYGIVMGSSHPEMLLRANVKEWEPFAQSHAAGGKTPAYDYSVNPEVLREYWDTRVETNGKYENGYSIGMRGVHDSGLVAANAPTTAGKLDLLQTIFEDQRAILAKRVNSDLSKVLQVFTPYKEVLSLYNAGLEVPEDATILWAEDNHGYVRQLPSDTERKRSGGAGVYYHLSYYGQPKSYLWLSTTPLPLIREELRKAYDAGASRLWVINVGDIKPGEIGLEFAMSLAWRIDDWTESNVSDFVSALAERDFGSAVAQEVADIVMQYYQINIARRPEFMDKGVYNLVSYGDEGQRRLDELHGLLGRASKIWEGLAAERRDGFYEMVFYPLKASALTMEKYVAAARSDLFASQGRTASVTKQRNLATAAYEDVLSDLEHFNETLAGGKWDGIIDPYVADLPVIGRLPELAARPAAAAGSALGVVVEGQTNVTEPATLSFSVYTRDRRFVDVFTKGEAGFAWTAEASASWLIPSKSSGTITDDERIQIGIDWDAVPLGDSTATLSIFGASSSRAITVNVSNPAALRPADVDGYVEANGYVAIEAEHFHGTVSRGGSEWRVLKQLGRSGDAVKVFPDVAPSVTSGFATSAPELDYQIYFFSTGSFPVTVFRIPTLNTTGACRLALAIDDDDVKVLEGANSTDDGAWNTNVVEQIEKLSTTIRIATPGYHTLRIWKVDPSIAIDRIVIDTGGLEPSYLGPPESYHKE